MEINYLYFKDEVREKFYVPGMVKRSWAMQIEILQIVARVCKKHNIRWFADFGTLLGAVRHRGFVPWDDDLDISMLRDDYDRFKQVIQTELPEGYKVNNFDTEIEYENFLTRIVNTTSINVGNEFLRSNCGIPYTIGIDIFPLDYIYADAVREEKRFNKMAEIWQLAETLSDTERNIEVEKKSRLISGIEITKSMPTKAKLLRILEKIFSECSKDTTEFVTLMPQYLKNKKRIIPIGLFSETIQIPFEYSCVNCVSDYEKMLQIRYGEWDAPRMAGGAHNYPFFADQERLLIEKNGKAPYVYRVSGIKAELLVKRAAHAKQTGELFESLASVSQVNQRLKDVFTAGLYAEMQQMIEMCQQMAISIGKIADKRYGEENAVTKCLEKYCENVFETYSSLQNYDFALVDAGIAKMRQEIENAKEMCRKLSGKGKILFVPVSAADWKYMLPLFEDRSSNAENEVLVMPAYHALRGNDGSVMEYINPFPDFTAKLPLVKPESIDFGNVHFSEIIIQNQFDEYQSGYTLHPFFYAKNLFAFTDKLIYCQSFEVAEFGMNDKKAVTNSKRYIIQPGIILADEIFVLSEQMRAVFCDTLAALPAEDVNIQPENIIVKCGTKSDEKERNLLLFYVSACDLLSKKNAISKLKETMRVFENRKADCNIVWALDEETDNNLKSNSATLADEFVKMRKSFETEKIGKIVPMNEIEDVMSHISGFYGSRGSLMYRCMEEKLAVMHWNA